MRPARPPPAGWPQADVDQGAPNYAPLLSALGEDATALPAANTLRAAAVFWSVEHPFGLLGSASSLTPKVFAEEGQALRRVNHIPGIEKLVNPSEQPRASQSLSADIHLHALNSIYDRVYI